MATKPAASGGRGDERLNIVVTHHLPSEKSIPAEHVEEPLSIFYVCDMKRLILERKPAVWIHGHTHTAVDYRFGATRVVANPRACPKEEDTRYRTLVLEEGSL